MQLAQQDRVDVATTAIVEWDEHFTYRSVDGIAFVFVSYFNSKMILYGEPVLSKEKPALFIVNRAGLGGDEIRNGCDRTSLSKFCERESKTGSWRVLA